MLKFVLLFNKRLDYYPTSTIFMDGSRLGRKNEVALAAKASLRKWCPSQNLPKACFSWAENSLESLIGDASSTPSLSLYRGTDPTKLVLSVIADQGSPRVSLQAILADHSTSVLYFDLHSKTCDPLASWKEARPNVPANKVATSELLSDSLKWPRGWQRVSIKRESIEVFVCTDVAASGMIVVRSTAADLAKHYSFDRLVYSFSHAAYSLDGDLYPSARFNGRNGGSMEVHLVPESHRSVVGDKPCIRGMLLPDEHVDVPLTPQLVELYRMVLMRVVSLV